MALDERSRFSLTFGAYINQCFIRLTFHCKYYDFRLNRFRKRTFQDFSNINAIKFGLVIKKVKVNPDASFVQIWLGLHPQCYIRSPKTIDILVQEKKIFEGYFIWAQQPAWSCDH